MTPEEYKVFQDNQKKPKSEPEPETPDDSVSVTQDPSKQAWDFFVLVLVWVLPVEHLGLRLTFN